MPDSGDPALLHPTVYLSGPVTETTHADLRDWRRAAKNTLGPRISVFDPIANAAIVKRLSDHPGATSARKHRDFGRAVVLRNRSALMNCDLVLVNLLGASMVSIGTVGEVFWADAYRKPLLVVREESGNPHDHLLMNDVATWTYHALDDALAHIATLLLPVDREAGLSQS